MKEFVNVGFIDPGGAVDEYFLTITKTDTKTQHIHIIGAMSWILVEGKIGFADIRADIAKIYKMYKLDILGCEKNNYGRSEIEAMRNEHGIKMVGINTSGKVTSEKVIKAGETMDKHQIVRWVNSWRTMQRIKKPKKIDNKQLKKLINQFDTFVVKISKSTGNPKYEAEGQSKDDGVMSLLGNFFVVKTRVLKIIGFARTVKTKKMLPRISRRQDLDTGLTGTKMSIGKPNIHYPQGITNTARYTIR